MRRLSLRQNLVTVALLTALLSPASHAQRDALTVLYSNRPPLFFDDNGSPSGTILERVHKALISANITPQFLQAPPKRALVMIHDDSKPLCSIAWFKTPAREAYAQFSMPIWNDQPWVVMSRQADATAIANMGSLSALLAQSRFSIVLLGGVSYGVTLDELLGAKTERVLVDNPTSVLRMVAAERADYTVLPPDMLTALTDMASVNVLTATTMPDIPAEPLYMMCTKATPAEWLEHFNVAYRALTPAP